MKGEYLDTETIEGLRAYLRAQPDGPQPRPPVSCGGLSDEVVYHLAKQGWELIMAPQQLEYCRKRFEEETQKIIHELN